MIKKKAMAYWSVVCPGCNILTATFFGTTQSTIIRVLIMLHPNNVTRDSESALLFLGGKSSKNNAEHERR
jgi:hypothetical protein